jgi:hypothetical protein
VLVGKLSLHDNDDVFAFVGAIVNRSGLRLDYHDRADLEAFLASSCWELSLKFRPGGIPFSALATRTLKLRIVGFQRAKYGRTTWRFSNGYTHKRERPKFVSLDDPDSRRVADELRRLAHRALGPNADTAGKLSTLLSRLRAELEAPDSR